MRITARQELRIRTVLAVLQEEWFRMRQILKFNWVGGRRGHHVVDLSLQLPLTGSTCRSHDSSTLCGQGKLYFTWRSFIPFAYTYLPS